MRFHKVVRTSPEQGGTNHLLACLAAGYLVVMCNPVGTTGTLEYILQIEAENTQSLPDIEEPTDLDKQMATAKEEVDAYNERHADPKPTANKKQTKTKALKLTAPSLDDI